MGGDEGLGEEYQDRREFFRERRWSKFEENKRKLERAGIPFKEFPETGLLKVGAFDFYATKGTFIHCKKRYTGRGVKSLIEALKKEER